MAKSLLDLDLTNPEFLKQNVGQYLVDKTAKQNYLVGATGLEKIGALPVNTRADQSIFFSEATGLIDKAMTASGSFQTSEGWKYSKIAPVAPSTQTFRPRRQGEDMGSYLREKQATGVGNIQLDGGVQATGVKEVYQYGASVLDKKANNASVNALYQSYFGRDASAPELANWGTQGGTDTTVRALEDFLKAERTKYGATDPITPIGAVKKAYEETTPISDIPTVDELAGTTPQVTVSDPIPAYEAQIGSLSEQIATMKTEMTDYWKTQEANKQTEIDDLNTKIAELQKTQLAQIEKADPAQSQFYDQQTIILQNQLDAAELASTKLTEDFNKARSLTAELETLNSQANADIQAMKGVTGLAAIRTPRINQKINEWTGRASILSAALAGVQDNINLSYQYIDKAQADITDRRNEEITYYNALIGYYGSLEETEVAKLTSAQSDKKEAAQNQNYIKQTENDKTLKTTIRLPDEMINDPARVAGAGINLATDNLFTISQKFADYDYSQEVVDKRNAMEIEGYTYLSSMTGITNENQITRITDSRGVERIYKNPPEKKTGTGTLDEGGYPKGFWTAIKTSVTSLQKGEKWGTVYDRLKLQFPNISNEDIDTALGTEWRKEGAFEEWKQKQYKETQPRVFEVEAGVWQWLATEEAINMSNDEKRQELMTAGFNPDDFGIY